MCHAGCESFQQFPVKKTRQSEKRNKCYRKSMIAATIKIPFLGESLVSFSFFPGLLSCYKFNNNKVNKSLPLGRSKVYLFVAFSNVLVILLIFRLHLHVHL